MSDSVGMPRWVGTLVGGVALTGAIVFPAASTAATLPVPCLPGACTAPNAGAFANNPNPAFVSSGQATATQTGNALTINQTSNQATLNWKSFNISSDGSVQFVQPGTGSIALNRIYDQSPSSILGQLTANGQIYLINPNGFLFGNGAKVNTAGIIASSLQISDANFTAGLLAPSLLAKISQTSNINQSAALSSTDDSGTVQYTAGDVTVQAGAQISSPGGRILLAAPHVQNAGTLTAPDGQVVLAAGQQVFLQASNDPALRGLVVEVNQGGKAWNQLMGQISADRGNISLIGAIVNQDGRLSATTSVSANGSVRLEAADTVNIVTGGASPAIYATNGGTLQLGASSQIALLPELTSTATAVADQEDPKSSHQLLLPSSVSLAGEKVFLEGGSIVAPGGQLNVTAAAAPEPPPGGVQTLQPGNTGAQIRIHAGTNIDLSGSSIELPMSDNLLALQLRANELADDPTQRNGALRGQTVYIDTRTGTPLVGSTALAAAVGTKAHGVGYYTTGGGTATFESEGDVVLEQGATVNVSGGKVTYDGGTLQTTQLIGANGRLVDIGKADPLQTYTGVVNPTFSQTYDKWGASQTQLIATPGLSHYYSGYIQGSSAGTLQFAAPTMVLGGSLVGQVVNGPLQRSRTSAATGGTLILGLAAGLPQIARDFPDAPPDFMTPQIELVARPTPVVVADGFAPFALPLQLPVDYLTSGGFSNTRIYGDTKVTLPAGLPLSLLPGSNFQIEAARVEIGSNVTAPSGTLSFQSVPTAAPVQTDIVRNGVEVGSGVTFDVRGLWTNDSQTMPGAAAPSGPTWLNGGSITLAQNIPGGELVMGDDVSFRASGGGWVSATNSLTGGTGGTISILDAPLGSALHIGTGIRPDAFGVNGARGGTFSFTAPRLLIDQGSPGANWIDAQHIDDTPAAGSTLQAGGVITVHSPVFTDHGFTTINLTAAGAVVPTAKDNDELTVAANTQIAAAQRTLLLNSDFLRHRSGGTVDSFSHLATQALFQRTPVSVNLSVLPPQNVADASLLHGGRVDVQTGSSLSTDPRGSISLASIGGVYVDGTLRVPGGTIALETVHDVTDGGYLPDLQIELGANARLDASGAVVTTPNQLGLRLGNVISGGTVNLFADRGTVTTDIGSKIDVSGTTATLDIPASMGSGTYIGRNVAGGAGSISVRSPLAVSLLGDLRAQAGKGDYGNPAGGSLEIDLTQSQGWFTPPNGSYVTPYPNAPDVIQIVSDTSKTVASAPDSGMAILGVSQLSSAGFDSLRLSAGNTIELSSSNALSMGKQIVLDSPLMSVDHGVPASIAANYIGLGWSVPVTTPPTVTAGDGTFSAHAQQIDLTGSFGFSGASTVNLTSAGDVSLWGVGQGTAPAGSLVTAGNLTINASRVYPYTLTAYSLTASGDGSAIRIGQTSSSPGVPLSAAGSLTLNADVIDSSGTLLAPFGSIVLNAGKTLALESGSVTSVSGAGSVIPFGQTQTGGAQWIYNSNTTGAVALNIASLADRDIKLSSPSVSVASGATLDLSGGGDLQAYEFVPGTGGSYDALAAGATVIPNLYAIIPGLHGSYGPLDPQESVAGAPAAGTSLYLSGGGGVAAGTYALLPARYALLPGAYLVKVESGYSNIVPGQKATLADGTPVVAGYLSFGNSGFHDAGFQGVAIWPGSYGQRLSNYTISEASTFFAAAATAAGKPTPDLPVDAGRLSILVGNQLDLSGKLLGQAANPAGQAAQIDISATRLEVTGSDATSQPGTVTLAASAINGWHAGSLVLGGTLSADRSGIQVAADSVTLDKGAQIQAGQVILTAGRAIDLQSGSAVSSNSASSSNSLVIPKPAAVALTGDSAAGAALVAVSDQMLPIAVRTGSSAMPATVTVESGATVASRGAIAIDAPGNVQINGTLNGSGASWSLSTGGIGVLGQSGTDSLQIAAPLLASMQNAAAVNLSAATAINFYQSVALGANTAIGSISLTAPALNYAAAATGPDASGTASFTAQTISLAGVAGQTASPAAGTGNLVFNAKEIDVGAPGSLPATPNTTNTPPASGRIALGGAATTHLNASSLVVGTGTGGGLSTSGDLTIATPVITAANAASSGFKAVGTLSLQAGPSAPGTLPSDYLGGALDFNADTISQQGVVAVPSGVVTMEAQNINLGSTARTDVSGVAVTIGDQVVGSEGGRIALNASKNLNLAAGSTLAASGATGSAAGQISLTAGGVADVGSTLLGKAGAGAQSGLFWLDAGSLTHDFTTLANSLQSGGFNQQVSVRVRQGDLALSSGAQLTANQLSLTSDTGNINVAGVISAPDSNVRGSIALFGGGGVTLASTGELHADTTGQSGIGGNIELGTAGSGTVAVQSGARISASGTAAGGTLTVRAPLASAAADIPVTVAQGSNLSGLGKIVIEPVMTEAATSSAGSTSMTAADFTRIQNDVTTRMNAAATNVATRLSGTTPIPVTVRAGIDIVQNGNLAVPIGTVRNSPNPNFNNWRFAGQPGDITFRASGDLTVTGTLSDGFNNTQKQPNPSKTTLGLNSGPASTFRLVAGADTASSNPLAILNGTHQTLQIGSPGSAGVVRATTGDIDLASSGDIVFSWVGNGPRSQVYTAGVPAVTAIPAANRNSSAVFAFPTQGGSIFVSAGGDIDGAAIPAPSTSVGPSVTTWQVRQGSSSSGGNFAAQWGVDLGQYAAWGWNLGSLGGGDVRVSSGGNLASATTSTGSMSNLSVAAADSYIGSTSTHLLSGGLDVRAAGDIGSGLFYQANGTEMLNAGGAFTAIRSDGSGVAGSLIALADTRVSLQARLGAMIDGVVNPTTMLQAAGTSGQFLGSFFTYTGDSSLNVLSSAGNVAFGDGHVSTLVGGVARGAGGDGQQLYPATLVGRALTGDVDVAGMTMFPSPTGQLELLAGRDLVKQGAYGLGSSQPVSMPDPVANTFATAGNVAGLAPSQLPRFQGNLHADDSTPALLEAGRDILGLAVTLPKRSDIVAGRDIVDLLFFGENLHASDTTLISAGRDYIDTLVKGTGAQVQFGGPGSLDVIAGRNVDLGFSSGIQTVGNLNNANLPTATGSDLTIMAGLGRSPDYTALLDKLVATDSGYQAKLVSYVESINGATAMSYGDATTYFTSKLTAEQRRGFLNSVFFNELLLSGREANTAGGNFKRGYAAIDTLFPNSRTATDGGHSPFTGNLSLDFSQIYTLSGGAISLLVPGGSVNVGLAVAPGNLLPKPAFQLGIVASGPGDIDIYSKNDVNVNASRVFTLGGGNILIWSNEGSIDAGQGAKTSVSAPAPRVLVSSQGQVSLDFSGAVAGSGIRTIQVQPTVNPGNVDLIAPVGTVNAGDAGIGAAGNINIAAQHVLGLDNIQVGGQATGVPASVSDLGVTLSSAASAASSATNSATSSSEEEARRAQAATVAPLAQAAISWLDVFVTGLGEENCKPDDMACLKRQKSN